MVAAHPTSSSTSDVLTELLAHRNAFKAFIASRIGNEADAEDLLQHGLVKALSRAGEIQDGQKAVAWFYQLLRNVIIDYRRSRHAAASRDDRWATEGAILADADEANRQICACFQRLLPTLKPTHAELIRHVELNGEAVSKVAVALGMTANNASVTLHRARGELRSKLMNFCGDCRCLSICECE